MAHTSTSVSVFLGDNEKSVAVCLPLSGSQTYLLRIAPEVNVYGTLSELTDFITEASNALNEERYK